VKTPRSSGRKATRSKTSVKTSSADRARARRLAVLFNITPEEHNAIKEFQGNDPFYKLLLAAPGKRDATDHSHDSGLVRGILEWRVNKAYGLLEKACPDNLPEVLRALALYHEYPPAVFALGECRYGLLGLARKKVKMLYGPYGSKTPQPRKSVNAEN
jgi:Recombination endonuclease VII